MIFAEQRYIRARDITMNVNHHKVACIAILLAALSTTSVLHADEKASISKRFTEGTKDFLSDPARTGSLVGTILVGATIANPLAPIVGSVAGFIIGKSSAFSKNDGRAERRQAYLNRSLTPAAGVEVTTLTGLTGESAQTSNQRSNLKLSNDTGIDYDIEQVQVLVPVSLPEERGAIIRSENIEPQLGSALPGRIIIVDEPEALGTATIDSLPGNVDPTHQPGEIESMAPVNAQTQINTRTSRQQQLAESCNNVQPTQEQSLLCYYFSK